MHLAATRMRARVAQRTTNSECSLSTNPGCSAKRGCWMKASTETALAVSFTLQLQLHNQTISLRSTGNRSSRSGNRSFRSERNEEVGPNSGS
eukprot:366351-Chlamydomonas_euryale.AAC.12